MQFGEGVTLEKVYLLLTCGLHGDLEFSTSKYNLRRVGMCKRDPQYYAAQNPYIPPRF